MITPNNTTKCMVIVCDNAISSEILSVSIKEMYDKYENNIISKKKNIKSLFTLIAEDLLNNDYDYINSISINIVNDFPFGIARYANAIVIELVDFDIDLFNKLMKKYN